MKFYYGAIPETVTVGIASPDDGDYSAHIILEYPQDVQSGVLAITKEMDTLEILPEVYVVDMGVLVIFRLPISSESIKKRLVHTVGQMISSVPIGTELILTGEADTDAESFSLFANYFGKSGTYTLAIARREDELVVPLWMKVMQSYGTELPSIL